MKVKIIKEVFLFEDELEVGGVYNAREDDDGHVYADSGKGDCLIWSNEYTIIEW